MPQPEFGYLFAPELYDRLVWFGRLRWLAVAGLAAAAIAGPVAEVPDVWPALLVVAVVVAAFNVLFTVTLRRRSREGHPYENLRACAVRQMLLDLAALLVTVHFTGGLQSPVLVFFVFHMAIGTIMLPTRLMYGIAVGTSLAMAAVYLAEETGIVGFHPLDPTFGVCGRMCHVNMVAFVVAQVGIVYLTDSVTSRFKQRNIELWRTTQELRHRTEELQRTLRQMEIVEERKSHYMRISAHQLRSPLATVRTSLQVLTEGYVDPASERGRKLLDGAVQRVDGLLAIVNDLLELAKMREGRARAPWTENVNVNQLLADLFDALEPYAEDRGIRLVPDFEGVAVLDWGIPPDLVYAFENLMQNAIKYSREGQTVTVRLRVSDERVLVEVEDHGIGIPEKFVDDVLLEFVRAPNARHHAPEGTGLGLAIAREAIEGHGGTLTLRSREGEGTTVTVSLPLAIAPPGPGAPNGVGRNGDAPEKVTSQ